MSVAWFRCQVACQVIHRLFEAALRQVEDTIRSRLQPWPRHKRGEEIADDGHNPLVTFLAEATRRESGCR